MKTISTNLAALFVMAASGCSFKPANVASSTQAAQKVEWTETTLIRSGTKLSVRSMPIAEQNKRKQAFRVPEIDEIRSNFSGSYTLYRIKNPSDLGPDAKNIIFIQPKVFVYGTAQGGNVLQLENKNRKSMSLTFAMAFVDGMISRLPSNEGTHAVALPDSLQIPDLAKLKEDLRSQIGQEPRLLPLNTCPRQMTLIHINGAEPKRLAIIPTDSIKTRCPINEFFSATVHGTREEITNLIQNGISGGLGVQLQADFQIQYREPIAFYSLQLDPSIIYKKLKALFADVPFGQGANPNVYLSFQLGIPLQELLHNALADTGATTAWTPYTQGIRILQDAFFDQVNHDDGCLPPNRCFRLKPEAEVKIDEPIELQWIEQTLLASSQIIPTITYIRGLAETYPLRVSSEKSLPMIGVIPSAEACASLHGNLPGCLGFSCDKFPENVYCRDGRTKNPIHHFQVFPGAKIRLAFDRITEWGFELPAPREDTTPEQRRGTIRCADSQPIPGACAEYEEYCPVETIPFCSKQKDECESEQKIFEDHCRNERVAERSCGFLGLGSCKEVLKENRTICERIETGKQCLKWKSTCDGETRMICPRTERRCKTPAIACNQWTTEFYSKYTYSEPWVRPRTIDIAGGHTVEQLWDGLDLEFSWLKEDGKTWDHVICPLKAFPNRIEGYSVTALLENQEETTCKPFNRWNSQPGRWPQISIINHINYERPYLCGTLEWTRSISADLNSKERVIDRVNYRCPERAGSASSDKPIVNTYQPIVDLQGTVSILGRSMDTISSTTRQ